jgi:hypothetical protein
MELLMRVRFDCQPVYFCTLTYPAEWPYDPQRWKRNLDSFHKALRRTAIARFQWAVWRLEPQRRGAPHFHLVIGFIDEPVLAFLRQEVRETWTRIVHSDVSFIGNCRVDVQRVYLHEKDGQKRLLDYLSKYVGKRQPTRRFLDGETGEILASGRMWGKWGKLPLADPVEVQLGVTDYIILMRRIRKMFSKDRWLGQANLGWVNWLAYIPATTMRQLLRGLGDIDAEADLT